MSPGWVSVTPKLAVTGRPPSAGCGSAAKARRTCFGPLECRGQIAVGAEHHEFLAAVAGHEVARSAGALQHLGEAANHFIAGRVAVGVVDLLELVDVANDQAARQAALIVGLDERALHAIEFGTVGHLRERIADRFFLQPMAAGFQRGFRRGVVQQQRDAVQACRRPRPRESHGRRSPRRGRCGRG